MVHKLRWFDEIICGFFLPGHSKNECDGGFGTSRNFATKHGSDV